MMSFKKCLVIGANLKIKLFLVYIPKKKNKLEAFALEIEDCSFKNVVSVSISIIIEAQKYVKT
jgi:hypothetical protein